MKRLKFHRAIVEIAMILIGWLPSLAYDFKVDGIYYNITSNTEVEISCYKYGLYSGNIAIPNTVENNGITYSVTSIGERAFFDCTTLYDIDIPDSVKSIGDFAFCGCSMLTDIKIPNSVIIIGDYAFKACYNLTDIIIGNSVTSIGDFAFYDCDYLKTIVIPNSVSSIGDYAFYYCI